MIIGAAVIRDIAKRYPEASIDLYCSNPGVSDFVLKLGEQVQGVHRYDAYSIDSRSILSRKARKHFLAVLHQHQENKYDLLVNLHVPKLIDWWFFEILLMRRSGAGFLAGFVPTRSSEGVLDRQVESDVVVGTHYLELYKELLGPLGIHVSGRGYFPVSKKIQKGKLAVIHPGASVLFKRWPVVNFVELARRLLDLGWDVVLVGDERERELGKEILASLPQVRSVVGTMGIEEMANLLASAELFIGNDSAPFHLAVAADVSAVGIFGAGPAMYSNYAVSNVRIARKELFCVPCFKNECAFNMECMTQLSVDAVWGAVCELID